MVIGQLYRLRRGATTSALLLQQCAPGMEDYWVSVSGHRGRDGKRAGVRYSSGAPKNQLRQIMADGLAHTYVRGGGRAAGLGVEFTDLNLPDPGG